MNFLYVSQYLAKMATINARFTSLTVSTTFIKNLPANTARRRATFVRKVIPLFYYLIITEMFFPLLVECLITDIWVMNSCFPRANFGPSVSECFRVPPPSPPPTPIKKEIVILKIIPGGIGILYKSVKLWVWYH